MIKGMHLTVFTPKAEELRAFMRDKLGFAATDVGEGWLIFYPPEAEIGFHPSAEVYQELSFYCDDIHATMAQLKAAGVEFITDVGDDGYAWVTRFRLPDDQEVLLYQPKYTKGTST